MLTGFCELTQNDNILLYKNKYNIILANMGYSYTNQYFTNLPHPYNKIGDGPEGPEVRRVAEYLQRRLTGLNLLEIQWDDKGRYRDKGVPDYPRFKQYLPAKINKIFPRGKNIIFELKNIYDSNIVLYMTNHLIMTGKWVYQPTIHSNLWLILSKDLGTIPEVQVLSTIFFDDTRHQGHIEFYYGLDHLVKEKFNKKVGPDLLDAAMTGTNLLPDWKRSIMSVRRKNVEIKNYLKEQKHFSGIGNYLRAEILYESKINPFRKLKDLSETDIELIYHKSLEIMKNSYLCHGLTISDYMDPEGYKGTYPVKIYKQTHDPYGNPVEAHDRGTKTKQTMHWVPKVQI